jgi:hypothetical protein
VRGDRRRGLRSEGLRIPRLRPDRSVRRVRGRRRVPGSDQTVLLACGCAMAPAGAGSCAARIPGQPVCAPSGACVQCVNNGDCVSTTPVCSGSNTCGPCAADADCSGRSGPVVCMAHQDGRCATDAEAIYVKAGGPCSDGGGSSGGTAAAPFCSMQPPVAVVGATRDLIVVRGTVVGPTSAFSGGSKQISIVGQSAATISSGVRLSVGDAYLRALTVGPSPSIGVQADAGSTLRLDHVTVNGNTGGGILVDGANFDIRNTTVTGNGLAMSGSTTWSGILVQGLPSTGPIQLQLSTVQTNMGPGVTCSGSIQAGQTLVTGNVLVQVGSACGFTSCGTAGSNCGAQL